MHSKFRLAALAAPPLAVAALGGWTALADPTGHGVGEQPVTCRFDLTQADGLIRIDAYAMSAKPDVASYQLEVVRPGARLSQSGSVELGAGQETALGQITVNGPRHAIDTTLTLTLGRTDMTCAERG